MVKQGNLRIIFVRHPETKWQNVKDPESNQKGQRLLGLTDVTLSRNGLRRARYLGKLLREEKISRIETSPLKRASCTAHIISSLISAPVIVREALSEIDFGDCEGLRFEDVAVRFPKVHEAYLGQCKNIAFPHGESFTAFRARVRKWLVNLLNNHDGETCLVVTHGGVIRVAICALLGWPIEDFWRIRQGYGAITTIGIYGKRRIIEYINSTMELPHEN